MQPTVEILEKVRQNSKAHPDEVFTKLFRYLLRPDLYFVAYQHLYANNGAATKGVDNDTADGFSEQKVQKIIQSLQDGSYSPKPSRRVYIKKANGRLRPLGIPTFTDKLVQEVLRMVMEAVYEPIFLDCSHGFRPNRSCHTALKDLKHQLPGTRWFVEGDIKGCFDNINHSVLVSLVNAKVKDARLIQLIHKFLKAGYLEDWQYHKTYSGTPQGGIISPLLANIYLHELDKFVMQMAQDFAQPPVSLYTPEYWRIRSKRDRVKAKIKTATAEEKSALLALDRTLQTEMLRTPSKSHTDKRIKYIRYADDFLIGVNGSKEDCEQIKAQLKAFIANTLEMELSEEKTLITHSNSYARFLGYDVRVRRNMQIKSSAGFPKRTLSNMVDLAVPFQDKIERFLFAKGIVEKAPTGKGLTPVKRGGLVNLSELEILMVYNAELRGLCNYYNLASNYYKLQYFCYLMEYSCLKTLAAKSKLTIGKVKSKYRDGKGGWGIPYDTKSGRKRMYLARLKDCKKTTTNCDAKPNQLAKCITARSTIESRLKAKVCALCGTTESERYEIHHVNKVKNLKGKSDWERIMITRRRKTIVLCYECHHLIHEQ